MHSCRFCGRTDKLEKNKNICFKCSYEQKLILAAQRLEDVLSGKVKWSCRKCGTSDVNLYRPRDGPYLCTKCQNERQRKNFNTNPLFTKVTPVAELDEDAREAVVPVPDTVTQIDSLTQEMQRLYREHQGHEMPDEVKGRIAEITAQLPELWAMTRKHRAGERMGW